MQDHLVPLDDNLYLIVGPFQGRFPDAFSYLAVGEPNIVVDTGFDPDLARWIQERYRPGIVVNTHSHVDHCRQNPAFEDAVVYVPAMTAETFGNVDRLSERFCDEPVVAEAWRRAIREDLLFKDCVFHRTYGDGEVFDTGRVRLRAVHTPGHLTDHFCFFVDQTGLLLSVDIDLSRFGPWYGNPESNIELFRASINRVRAMSPRRISSAHRMPVDSDADGELARYEARFDETGDKILGLLDKPRSLTELVEFKPIYGKHPHRQVMLRYFESQMIRKQLTGLEEVGRIRRAGNRYERAGN